MSGILNVTINDRNQADPIAGAKVFITEHGSRDKVIKELETNNSGQINDIELESRNGGYSNLPYKKYDLIVQVPPIQGRYNEQQEYIKSGVQVWNDRITVNQDELLQIRQLELARAGYRNNVIEIEENSIVQQEPTKLIQNPLNIPDPKPLIIELPSEPGTLYAFPPTISVPRYPYIPSEIDIYLGAANPYEAAKPINKSKIITEDFRKYLRMVSAQEFGGIANLTEQAGIALFLLSNSFALNRVYTELYRNVGYQFNITNNINIDQHYPKGGITFQHTDLIVEKYFNKYIKIKEKNQPLLTQYCAGKTDKCSNGGIPQIGLNNRSLNNRELTHQDLLKYYLDKLKIEFEIVTADVVEGNPKSYPGSPLLLGSNGGDVFSIQEFLKLFREKNKSFPPVDVNGVFDEKTQKAVLKFQEIYEKGKKNKGVVDEATWYKMSDVYVKTFKLAEPPSRLMQAYMF
ncbi:MULTISPECIES: peptidoglycan-binding protein [unclassified Paenibacillus]|uniref:peptidoglycan-binding domain-containing protein n=1 Tax=unclassified Paenibacillus TaxID=185978 RepID=UPI0004F7A6CA|nr:MULTISPECIES: peptidoglycan-binding domain-containing protein [unclassified Paenibacillus]AIQ29869.1 hypothetical protein P40081_18165 [Paenibacillus sp. FSL P4-0081]OMF25085.1 hypothetical protein BK132_22680 [Paenibacillus sp. FSL H8-0259]